MCYYNNEHSWSQTKISWKTFWGLSFIEALSLVGLFVLNLACRDSNLRLEVLSNIRSHFPCLVSYNIPDEVNEVVIAARQWSMIADEAAASAKLKFKPTLKAFKRVNQVRKNFYTALL